MRSLNLVQLIGNITRDPEIKSLDSGLRFCTVSIATNRVWKDKNSGEKKQEADFHNLVIWGTLVDVFEKWVRKGDPLYISGELRTRIYEKDGQKHYRTEINVRDMNMLKQRGEGEGGYTPTPPPDREFDTPEINYTSDVSVEELPF